MIFVEKKKKVILSYIEYFCRKYYEHINVGVRNKYGTKKVKWGKNRKGKHTVSLTKIILGEGDCEWTCLSPATYLKWSLENDKLLSVCISYLTNSLCLVLKFLKESEVFFNTFL